MKGMIKRKLKYAGHVLRDPSDLSHLQILAGPLREKANRVSLRIQMKGRQG